MQNAPDNRVTNDFRVTNIEQLRAIMGEPGKLTPPATRTLRPRVTLRAL
jgi:hypothetical protein